MHVHTFKIKITMRTQSVYQFLVSGSFVKVFNHDLVSGDRSPFPSSSSAALTCSDRDEPRFSLLKHLKDMRGKGGELSLLLVCKIQEMQELNDNVNYSMLSGETHLKNRCEIVWSILAGIVLHCIFQIVN